MSAANDETRAPGRLVLVPNTLDLDAAAQPLPAVLPLHALETAAQLAHWLVEDAKSARAFLKRVGEVVPLRQPLQALAITELPRPPKGRPPAPVANARAGHAARPSQATGRPPPAMHMPHPAGELLAPALAGHDLGLLSEAGLPAVADPGAGIVAAAHELGVPVLPLAGPSSITLALAASGLEGQRFAFVGYLPQEAAARRERVRELEATSRQLRQTQVFIETPYRNAALLAALLEAAAAGTRLSVSIGLTLPEGWCRTATVGQWRRSPPQLSARLPAVFLLLA